MPVRSHFTHQHPRAPGERPEPLVLSASKTKPCRLTCSLPSPLTLNQHFMRLRYGLLFEILVTEGFDSRHRRHRQAGGSWATLAGRVPDLILLQCPRGCAITVLLNPAQGLHPEQAVQQLSMESSDEPDNEQRQLGSLGRGRRDAEAPKPFASCSVPRLWPPATPVLEPSNFQPS